jgi:hypothetical protein
MGCDDLSPRMPIVGLKAEGEPSRYLDGDTSVLITQNLTGRYEVIP